MFTGSYFIIIIILFICFFNDYILFRIYLSCFRLITKLYRDYTFSNTDFAKIAGIPIYELNNYELELFKLFDYNLFISKISFKAFCKKVN